MDIPESAQLWLERDVAEFLHQVADEYFDGDRPLALNELLRIPMAMYAKPSDVWAAIEQQNAAHVRARQRR